MKTSLMIMGLIGMMSTMPMAVHANSTASVQMGQQMESISSFCQDRLMTLKRAYYLAGIESQKQNHAASLAILENALREAAARINPYFSNTLTSKAIKRGVGLLNNLKATQESPQKLRTINHFLFSYFLFIESVANRLDIPYYQVGNGGYSAIPANNVAFEKLFLKFAKEQVGMVLATMSTQANEQRSPVIYPIGSPTLLLTALGITTQAMALDLSESIFAARYACMIQELHMVSSEIEAYLTTKATFPDEFTAVQVLVGSAMRAYEGARGCGPANGGYDGYGCLQTEPRTTDAISDSFRLYAGTTQQVTLNGQRYIKKLIISAEGVRSDAMFDVVVNGDVKGTIYVPGRDPSYFVTIEDYADSIEFVSRNGTAIISRILVVSE